MDDRLKESLSAMFDDEADELGVRRVLALGEDNEVRSQWLRWQRLSDRLRNGESRWDGIDMRADIWARLDMPAEARSKPEVPYQAQTQRPVTRSPWRNSGSAALVAMLVVAVMVGFGAGQQWTNDRPEAEFAATGGALPAQNGAAEPVPQVALGNLDAAQREELSNYLLRHARHNSAAAGNGAVGFARVASVSLSGADR